MNADDPIALKAYEEIAQAYAQRVDTKPHNAYYDRPAILSLLPGGPDASLSGKSILDAGCGPGVYTEIFLAKGASVVAVDVSPKMVDFTRQRVQNRAQVHEADLAKPMPFLPDASFDLIVSPLVLHYIRSLKPTFREFHRLLKPGGHFIFSTSHPAFDFIYFKSADYFSTEKVGADWKGFGRRIFMPCYRRPLSTEINSLLESGFALETVLEPKPTEEFLRADPESYEQLIRHPAFICFRARK